MGYLKHSKDWCRAAHVLVNWLRCSRLPDKGTINSDAWYNDKQPLILNKGYLENNIAWDFFKGGVGVNFWSRECFGF